MAEFVKALEKSDLPEGQGKRVDIQGNAIAVFHVDGQFYAISNTCLHQGGPLAEGELEGNVVFCPWHRWQYNVTTGHNDLNPEMKVRTFPVKVEGDSIFVEV